MSQSAETTDRPRTSSTSVVYRHVTLIDGADLTVHEDRSVFVAMEEPPPIRTVVQLWRAEQARAVLVSRVVEVPEADPAGARGFYAIPADEAAIAAARIVGTEHLKSAGPGDLQRNADPGESADGDDVSGSDPDANSNMAMPAPVVADVEDEPEAAVGEDPETPEGESSDGSGRRKRPRKKKR